MVGVGGGGPRQSHGSLAVLLRDGRSGNSLGRAASPSGHVHNSEQTPNRTPAVTWGAVVSWGGVHSARWLDCGCTGSMVELLELGEPRRWGGPWMDLQGRETL